MGYGNTTNTILLPDEEEQLVREELGRLANNQDERRDEAETGYQEATMMTEATQSDGQGNAEEHERRRRRA